MTMLKIGTKVRLVDQGDGGVLGGDRLEGTVVGYGYLDRGPEGLDRLCEKDPWTMQPVYLVKHEGHYFQGAWLDMTPWDESGLEIVL